VSNQYDIVVNCSGVGARQLVGDNSVESIRGQIIRCLCICLCRSQEVVLGGISQIGDWDLQHRDLDREYVWKTCTTLLPCLQNAEIVKDWTGLRPARKSIRLEVEYRRLDDRSMTVVHCYGHGGSGITLHWGCAKEVADL
ncbi:hypothetical protein CHS0354_014029, partial [Potamilus streckersoni]